MLFKNLRIKYFSNFFRYNQEHTWLSINKEKKIARCGISYYAQKQIGDIEKLKIPCIGEDFKQNQKIGEIESPYINFDLYAPLTCSIVDINKSIIKNSKEINLDSESNWIYEINFKNNEELEDLLNEENYKKFTDNIENSENN